jgi:hypothetical protein
MTFKVKSDTYIVLIDIAVGNLRNLELIDSKSDRFAGSVETRAARKGGWRMLEFSFI